MIVDRRTMLGAMASVAATPAFGKARAPAASRSSWFNRAIVIDALGSTGDPYGADGVTRLGERAWAETVATGVTMLRDTVFPVGNVADPWQDYQDDIVAKNALFAANPDRLMPIRSAADILKAKRERKFGVLLGTQDSCMVGPELDRLAQLKKDGVLTVQLTYNNRNLCGDGALEPPMPACRSWAGRRSSGSRRKNCCLTSVTAAPSRWPRRRQRQAPFGDQSHRQRGR